MSERRPPGRWLARLAPWLVDARDVERAVEPALADLHFEWAALEAEGRGREAQRLARAALFRIALVVLPALVVRRRAERLLEARWAPLVPALAAAALGTWAFRDAAPSPAYVTLQLAYVGAGLVLALVAGTTSAGGWRRFGPAWGLSALGALALALSGEGAGGARRWALLGPLRVQTSLLFWPLFVVGLAALGERGRYGRALGLLAAALLLLAAQRDPATALPWALAAWATLRAAGAPGRVGLGAIGVGAIGVGLSFASAVALAPLPHVEGVWGLLARQNPPGALAALACSAAIVAAPFAAARRSPDRFARGVACGLGALSAGLFLRPLVAAEPVPLLGYGGSGAIGVLLGLGLVAGLGGETRSRGYGPPGRLL
ncbi:MAG TPA: hypothetical protein VFS43_22320 [Polyangiaceae bacterium]|nr:hypothetical protein [Polyangiaceae bacterium]